MDGNKYKHGRQKRHREFVEELYGGEPTTPASVIYGGVEQEVNG